MDSPLDACPDNAGAYHSGDPADSDIDDGLLSGCAIGMADVDTIEDVSRVKAGGAELPS